MLLLQPTFSENFNEVFIEGNERISDETIKVFSQLSNNEKSFDEDSINIILKNLYETGFFKDVSVKIENKQLIINVVENPIIQSRFIEGIKTNRNRELIEGVLLLQNRSSFNIKEVKKDELSIINILKKKGYYFANVKSSIEDLGDNKINLTYLVNLGKKAKITKISFIGNKIFKKSTLENIIVTEEHKFWKIISGKKFLNKDLIQLDKRLLYNFYRNKGYYNVIIEPSFANYIGEEKFELVFSIEAGKKHYFNNFKLNLPTDYDIENFEELTSLFKKLKGEPYSLNSIDKILTQIDKIALNEQYEFLSSSVNEIFKDNFIDFEFNIEELENLYVEKINIFGNNITREQVIRNSLEVDEGDAFNTLRHNKSINNLKSLNFFNNIRSEILEGTTSKQKIINLTVEEKPTGQISAGAGVGSDGGSVGFGIQENNFLGRGIQLATDLTISSESIKGLLSLNNPNFNGQNRSLNFNLQSTSTDRMKNYGYKSNKHGFELGSGFEYYDDLFVNMGFSSYVETIKTDSSASASIIKQKGSFFDTYINYTFDYDKRNQKFRTSNGYRSRFTQSVPVLSESFALKNSYNFKVYGEWLDKNVASFGFFANGINSLTGKDVKLSDRLFVASSKLRGFETGKVGPMDGADFIGGNYATGFNLTSTIPQILPNSDNTNFSIFLDAANIWGVDYNSTLSNNSKIKSSIGIAVDFFTPIGPLNFSLSEVLSKHKNDVSESFRFNLGTTF